jgi:hypothetical protein
MPAHAHFNPAELRDPHGKWSRSGSGGRVASVLHRMAGEVSPGDRSRDRAARTMAGRVPWHTGPDGDTVHYHDSLGIDRAGMPQLSGNISGTYHASAQIRPQFMAEMEKRGVPVTQEKVRASELRPSQTTGSLASISGIAANIRDGQETKPIIVSADDRVIDGHHTWAAHAITEAKAASGRARDPGMDVVRVGLPADELIAAMREFSARKGIALRRTGEIANPAYAAHARAAHARAG